MAKNNKLSIIDELIYDILKSNVDNMPIRFTKLIANYYTDARIRKLYWEKLGIKMGENTYANLGLKLATANNELSVYIGNNVSIAANVTFITDSSANNGIEINKLEHVKEKLTKSANIIVEDEVWIGAGVIILPGVNIGKCSVIGAGSVVTKNVDSYSVYAGSPAKKIRDLVTGKKVLEEDYNG